MKENNRIQYKQLFSPTDHVQQTVKKFIAMSNCCCFFKQKINKLINGIVE